MREQYKSYIVSFLFMSLMVLLAASCNKYVDDEIIPVFNPNWKPIPSEIDQDIPVVYITTEKGAAITSKEEYVRGYISISDKKGRYLLIAFCFTKSGDSFALRVGILCAPIQLFSQSKASRYV